MTRLRTLSLLLALAAVLLTAGTGAFNTVSTARDTSISVAEDSEALLGIETSEPTLEYGTNGSGRTHSDVSLVTISNHFGTEMTVTVTDTSTEPPHAVGKPPVLEASVDAGESVTVATDVVCRANGDSTVSLRIEASTGSTTVEKTKAVPVTCSRPETGGGPTTTPGSDR